MHVHDGRVSGSTRLGRSVARRLLRYELHRACIATGTTHQEAAARLDMARASFTQILAGKNLISRPALEILATHLNRAQRLPRWSSLLAAARARNPDPPGLCAGEDLMRGIERFATYFDIVDTHTLWPLIQVPNYARALRRHHPESNGASLPDDLDEELQQLADLVERQRLLADGDVEVRHLVDEHCLRRVVGPPAVMAEQYEHLLTLVDLLDYTFAVVPSDAPARLYPLPSQLLAYEDIAVTVQWTADAAHCDDTPAALARHNATADALHAVALSPAESRRLLVNLLGTCTR